MELDYQLTPYTRISSKYKSWNIKILEENIGNKISGISYSNNFADISPWAKETKEK